MNGGWQLDADQIAISIGLAIAGGAAFAGWRLIRSGRRASGAAVWVLAMLTGLAVYFFATFSIRLM